MPGRLALAVHQPGRLRLQLADHTDRADRFGGVTAAPAGSTAPRPQPAGLARRFSGTSIENRIFWRQPIENQFFWQRQMQEFILSDLVFIITHQVRALSKYSDFQRFPTEVEQKDVAWKGL